ncbi:MAG: hypothetical protein AB1752_14540, partial [Candidatus Zixiibacteriota bacterium]
WHQRLMLPALAALMAAVLLTSSAHAIGLGARAGMSLEPDQFVLGGQAMIGQVFPMIELAPGLDLGFGNDVSTTVVNVDFRFNLPSLPKVSPNIYVGAGPAYVSAEPDGGKRDGEIAASIFAGMRIPFSPVSSYNLEARFGLGDYPDMKFLFGVLFGL